MRLGGFRSHDFRLIELIIAVRKFEILPGIEPGSDKADATDWPRIVLQNTYGFISRIRTYDAIKQRA